MKMPSILKRCLKAGVVTLPSPTSPPKDLGLHFAVGLHFLIHLTALATVLYEKRSMFQLSGNEVYYINALMLVVMYMLCSELRRQKYLT